MSLAFAPPGLTGIGRDPVQHLSIGAALRLGAKTPSGGWRLSSWTLWGRLRRHARSKTST